MIFLRWLFFTTPVWVVAAIYWLANDAGRLRYRADSDLVVAVREIPRVFNPLLPAAGGAATREIAELLFDRPFRRDDELKLRAHLVQSLDARQKVTIFFSSPENAEAATKKIAESREKWPEWGLLDAVREKERIFAMIKGHRPGSVSKVKAVFEPEWLAQLHPVRAIQRLEYWWPTGAQSGGGHYDRRHRRSYPWQAFVPLSSDLHLLRVRHDATELTLYLLQERGQFLGAYSDSLRAQRRARHVCKRDNEPTNQLCLA